MGMHVALVRGINVGKAKRLAMADLRALVEALGYGDVHTLLNSGNVVFRAKGAAGAPAAVRIEEAIREQTGITARVTVLSAAELSTALAENPLLDIAHDPSRLLVTVLRQAADRGKLDALAARRWSPDALAIGRRVAYVWCSQGILASKLADAVQRALGDAATSRNWATMQKLAELVESHE